MLMLMLHRRDLAEQNWVESQMSGYGVLTKSYWLGYSRATTSSAAPWYADDDPLNPVVPQPAAGPRNANPYRHWCASAAAAHALAFCWARIVCISRLGAVRAAPPCPRRCTTGQPSAACAQDCGALLVASPAAYSQQCRCQLLPVQRQQAAIPFHSTPPASAPPLCCRTWYFYVTMNPQASSGCALTDWNLNYLTFNGDPAVAAQINSQSFYTLGTLAAGAAAGWSSTDCMVAKGPAVCEFMPMCPPSSQPAWTSPPAQPTCERHACFLPLCAAPARLLLPYAACLRWHRTSNCTCEGPSARRLQ
jgi:hypothetical protein